MKASSLCSINSRKIPSSLTFDAKHFIETPEGKVLVDAINSETSFLNHLDPTFLERLSYFINEQKSVLFALKNPPKPLKAIPFPLKENAKIWNNFLIRNGSKASYMFEIFLQHSIEETIRIFLDDPVMNRHNTIPNLQAYFPFIIDKIHASVPDETLTIIQKIKTILYGQAKCKHCGISIPHGVHLQEGYDPQFCQTCRHKNKNEFTYVPTESRKPYDELKIFLEKISAEKSKLSIPYLQEHHSDEFDSIGSWCQDFCSGQDINPLKTIESMRTVFLNKGPKLCPTCGKIVKGRDRVYCSHKCNALSPNRTQLNKDIQHQRNIKGKEEYFRSFPETEYLGMDSEFSVAKFRCRQCNREFSIDHPLQTQKRIICTICYTGSSIEREIVGFIESVDKDCKILRNRNDIIPPKQIDIWLPDYNLGIEVNGIFWHSYGKARKENGPSEARVDKLYHQKKSLECRKKGIKLLQITDLQWSTKKKIIKSKLRYELKKNTRRIYARKCEVKEVDNKKAKAFLEKYHVQGKDNASIKLGLFFKNRLVALATFCKPRFDKKCSLELSRFCTISSFSVVGGFSKLLSNLEKRSGISGTLVTYCDLSLGDGHTYDKYFTFSHVSSPNYWWVKKEEILSRYQTQKHLLKNFLENYDENLSEKENMIENDWRQYFDCGNLVFTKTL